MNRKELLELAETRGLIGTKEAAAVETALGDAVICSTCGATLETYADLCSEPLDVACPGFVKVEETRALVAASLRALAGGEG